jgi:plastocyanin
VRAFLAALVAGLVLAPAASAQDVTIQAIDGTEADNYNNRWSPKTPTIKVGDTVTWTFAGTSALHNVASSGANWSPAFRNGNPASGPPPASYTFTKPGTYRYLCEVHANTMFGDVIVTDASGNPPPPPPPPPLSEQPFPNDAGAPSAFEVDDGLAPRLSRMWARGRRHAARVGFRLDEPAVVTVRVRRARITVKRSRAMLLRGKRRLTIRHLRPGAYSLVISARDLAGNRARTRRARVTVR